MRLGPMAQHIKASMNMIRKMARENSLGRIKKLIKENLSITIWKEMVFIFGKMGAYMTDNGVTIKWRVKENSRGKMAESMLVNT